MILKGGAVGGGGLAAHLQSQENESVEIVQAERLLSRDIAGAVAELRARGAGITAKPIFHTAISAAPGQKWGEVEQRQAVAAFVKEFKLEGVPLLVVRHQKDAQGVNRDVHLHVVASRIDERGRAIRDAFTHVRNERVSRCLEHALGHPLTVGKHNKAVINALRREGRADVAEWMVAEGAHTALRPTADLSHAEAQQQNRNHITKAQAGAEVLATFRAADCGLAFRAALAERGYRLAKGREAGAIMVIDSAGGAHELTRLLRAALKAEGDKRPAKDVRAEIDARLTDLDRVALPLVAEATAQARDADPLATAESQDSLTEPAAELPTADAMLNRLMAQSSTFTQAALERVLRPVKDEVARASLRAEILGTALALPASRDGLRRYTIRAAAEAEARLRDDVDALAATSSLAIDAAAAEEAIEAFDQAFFAETGHHLSDEQRAAARHVLVGADIATVTGTAGAGKSTMLEAARAAWLAAGFDVRGMALSGIAAERLSDTGITSATIHSQLLRWDRQAALADVKETKQIAGAGKAAILAALDHRAAAETARGQEARASVTVAMRAAVAAASRISDLDRSTRRWLTGYLDRQLADQLTSKSVIVLDEAGMVPVAQLQQVAGHVRAAGGKLVAVGDPEQLQPVERGAAFRVLQMTAQPAEIREVLRQREDWQRRATEAFASGDAAAVAKAVEAYNAAGAIVTGLGGRFDAAGLRTAAEAAYGPISDKDADRLATIATYAQARAEAGTLWHEIAADGGAPGDHPLYDAFKEQQRQRDKAAEAIGADLDGCRLWLARLGVDGRGLAADMLFADGLRRAEAESRAVGHAAALGLDTLETDGPVLSVDAQAAAREALLADWKADLARDGLAPSRLILTFTRTDVAALNQAAREAMRAAGHLDGEDVVVSALHEGEAADLAVTVGDRLMCLKNNSALAVRNGSAGRVTAIRAEDGKAPVLTVALDGGRVVEIDTGSYRALQHSYATSIHRAQGTTVDRAWFLDSRLADRCLAYVACSRHREALRVYSTAPNAEALARRWGRARSADAISDFIDPRELLRRHQEITDVRTARTRRLGDTYNLPRALRQFDAVEAANRSAPRHLLRSLPRKLVVAGQENQRAALLLPGHQGRVVEQPGPGGPEHLRRRDLRSGAVAAPSFSPAAPSATTTGESKMAASISGSSTRTPSSITSFSVNATV